MNELAVLGERTVAKFNPAKTLEITSALSAAVAHAKRLKDWESLDDAIGWLIDEQQMFVDWWDKNVARSGAKSKKLLFQDGNNNDHRMSATRAEEKTKISAVQTSRWRTRLKRPAAYRLRLKRPSYKQAMADPQNRADLHSGVMEWFTPADYIEKARRVLGSIDVDPASCKQAQKRIKAKKFFVANEDGLKQEWVGRVWLNPPYAGALISAFAAKLIEQIEAGNVSAAIMLTNAYTETSWFHNLANTSGAICLTKGRIKFESPEGEKRSPTNGQCFFYFGDQAAKFAKHFDDVGMVLKRYA